MFAATAADAGAVTVDGATGQVIDREGTSDDLRITATDRDGFIVTSGAGALTARAPCQAAGPRTVTCPHPLGVELGSGDDRLFIYDCICGELRVNGGPGSDRLRSSDRQTELFGGPGRDVLRGGPADDLLSGGGGEDRIHGGGGNDVLDGDGDGARDAADDRLEGGPGRDFVKWGDSARVVASLALGRGGRRGERDGLKDIESLMGSAAGDRLVGDARSNTLYGGRGRDVLSGGAGHDRIDPDRRRILTQGTGTNDARDRVACGAGSDRVIDPRSDVIAADCERMAAYDRGKLAGQAIRVQPVGRRRSGVLRFEVACDGSAMWCTRRVAVHVNGRLVGRSRPTRVGRTIDRSYFVSVRVRRPISARQVVSVTVTGGDRQTNLGGEPPVVTYRYRFGYRYRASGP